MIAKQGSVNRNRHDGEPYRREIKEIRKARCPVCNERDFRFIAATIDYEHQQISLIGDEVRYTDNATPAPSVQLSSECLVCGSVVEYHVVLDCVGAYTVVKSREVVTDE